MAGFSSFTSQVMAALGRLRLFATAALPSSPPTGQLVYDTTTDGVKVANNAGTFTAVGGGGGGITIGQAVVGGGANQVIYENAAQVLSAEAAFTYVDTTNTLSADNITASAGAAATPSINFAGHTTGGLWATATTVDISTSGAHGFTFFNGAAPNFVVGVNGKIGFSDQIAPLTAPVTYFQVAATNVMEVRGAGPVPGWMRNVAGELALNADYTNATAGFTATALSASVISGRTYSFELVLFFQDSTAADGAQFDFNGGGATVTNFRAQAFAVNAVGAALAITNAAVTSIATAIQVALALTTQAMIVVKGTFVPSSSSTFIVRAAQTAHSTGTLTVDRGSYLNIRDANPL